MKAMINQTIRRKKEYDMQLRLLEMLLSLYYDEAYERQLAQAKQRLAVTNALLSTLDADEAFVISRRIIEDLGWAKIYKEFEEMWGAANLMSARTFRRIQASAYAKMESFAVQDSIMYQILMDKQ